MFIVVFFSLVVFSFSFLCLVVDNLIVWWSVFLMMTVLFVMIMKSEKSYAALFNYFVVQESLGLLFLVFSLGLFQVFIVMLKIGVAPFHFWLFSVINDVSGYALVWFLTFQKLPFFVILLQLFSSFLLFVLLFGLLVCYFQIVTTKNYKNLLVLSSTESFNWILFGVVLFVFNSFLLFFYYFFLLLVLLNKMNKSEYSFVNWETALVFMNIPFSVTFFVKIFSLSELFKFDSVFSLLILFSMFLSVLSFSFWLVSLSTKLTNDYTLNSKVFYFLLYSLSFFVLV